MRLSIILKSLTEYMPVDYRRVFVSILKNAFSSVGEDVYNELYGRPRVKPFTFSVYFNKVRFPENSSEIVLEGKREIHLFFSTFKYKTGIQFYNGLLKAGKAYTGLPIFDYQSGKARLQLMGVKLRRERIIKGNSVVFRILSPVVVRKHQKNNIDKYITIDDGIDVLESQLNVNMEPVFKEFLGEKMYLKIEPYGDGLKTVPVKITDGKGNTGIIKGNIGMLKISAPEEALRFIYQSGIGARRSYGFGMLEVIDE